MRKILILQAHVIFKNLFEYFNFFVAASRDYGSLNVDQI